MKTVPEMEKEPQHDTGRGKKRTEVPTVKIFATNRGAALEAGGGRTHLEGAALVFLIRGTNGWTLAGIYSDLGISGTSTKHRPGFQQMMEDCRSGLIDRIITKSVSRFARNTLDSLNHYTIKSVIWYGELKFLEL